jgi:phosphate-selective porin OprO/OprP
MEEMGSSKYISFVERSAPTGTFSPSRNLGFDFEHVFTEAKRVCLEYGIFREVDDDIQIMEDGAYALTLRLCAWFLEDEETHRVLHVGFGFSLRDPPGESVRYRSRQGVGFGDRSIDTGTIGADEVTLFNFEIALVWKSFHFQAEFFAASVDGGDVGVDADFSGFYVEIGWFITGESRNYDKKKFLMDRTKPKKIFHDGGGGFGAVQLVFRFDTVDLSDGSIVGGELDTFTVGVNWHWNPNCRIMVNVVFADVTDGGGAGGTGTGDLTTLVMRLQFDF